MIRPVAIVVAAVMAPSFSLSAQQVSVRTASYFERYTFDSLSFSAVSEFTLPVSLSARLGRWGSFTVSGGYVKVDLESRTAGSETQSVSGALDTEARLAVEVLPGRLTLLANGAIPTGIESIESSELSMLAVVSRDIIGFAASDLGTGGYVGTGVAAAVPVGQMALGLAAVYRYQMEYRPIAGEESTLKPGADMRFRAGLEGPVSQRTYLRIAGIAAVRQKDVINNAIANGIGNRLTGYFSLDQGIGRASTLSLYMFDVFRGSPQIEQTAYGAAFLPRGNLLAAGARSAHRLSARTDVVPRLEYRVSHSASDTTTTLERTGSSLRFGLDLRQRISPRHNIVLSGSYLTGDVQSLAGLRTDVSVRGFRVALLLEVRP
jgi:hypothetical protein